MWNWNILIRYSECFTEVCKVRYCELRLCWMSMDTKEILRGYWRLWKADKGDIVMHEDTINTSQTYFTYKTSVKKCWKKLDFTYKTSVKKCWKKFDFETSLHHFVDFILVSVTSPHFRGLWQSVRVKVMLSAIIHHNWSDYLDNT